MASSIKMCIVCGASETEVQNFFCFPHNPEKNQLWMQILGLGNVKKQHRICSKHFSRESFTNSTMTKLNRNANPLPWVSPSPGNKLENLSSSIKDKHDSASNDPTLQSSVSANEGEANSSSSEQLHIDTSLSSLDINDPTPRCSASTQTPKSRSPICHNLERNFASLHTKNTNSKRIPFRVGIDKKIFEQIDKNLSLYQPYRCCLLVFGEMDIKVGLQYDSQEDRILGFEDFGGSGFSKKVATKALVFMLVGLEEKEWKQPVAYFFSHGYCRPSKLKECLFEVLSAAKNIAKVEVVATICDTSPRNVGCLKELGVTIETPYFFFEKKKIFSMFDPPSLLKCTFNLFRKYDVSVPVKVGESTVQRTAKFEHVVQAREADRKKPSMFRSLYKIREDYLRPECEAKTHIAGAVLSYAVAVSIFYLGGEKPDSDTCASATFIKDVDTLFDSFNGQEEDRLYYKKMKRLLKYGSHHMRYWRGEARETVENWQFLRYNKRGRVRKSLTQCQKGWLQSLEAIQEIWIYLRRQMGFISIKVRYFNQDPLENLFEQIRHGCGYVPTVRQFVETLNKQLVEGLFDLRSLTYLNLEDDRRSLLFNLKPFQDDSPLFQSPSGDPLVEIAEEVSTACPKVLSVAHVAGALLKHLKNRCTSCDNIISSCDTKPQNLFLTNKEWNGTSVLTYPSEKFTIAVGCGITRLEEFLNSSSSHREVSETAHEVLRCDVNLEDLGCPEHKENIRDLTNATICKIVIPQWCQRISKEIRKKILRKKRKQNLINKSNIKR